MIVLELVSAPSQLTDGMKWIKSEELRAKWGTCSPRARHEYSVGRAICRDD